MGADSDFELEYMDPLVSVIQSLWYIPRLFMPFLDGVILNNEGSSSSWGCDFKENISSKA